MTPQPISDATAEHHDLAVVGGGTAGLVAALVASAVGLDVVLVEAERTGGDCLWTGCVPSKSLLAAAETAHRMRTADRFGLEPVEPTVDLGKVLARVREVQAAIEPVDSPERLRAEGIAVVEGRGRFAAPGRLVVETAEGEQTIGFGRAVVATGSSPSIPPIPGLAEADPLTTDTIWELDELPRRLLVVGGGAIGAELGQAFARLGSSVTLVEAADRLLGALPADAAAVIDGVLRTEGVEIRTGRTVTAIDAGHAVLDDGERVPFDRVLVAVGRRPRTAGLGLDVVGVELDDRGAVMVDDRLRTTADGIYAGGDVTDLRPLTSVAAAHGRHIGVHAAFGYGAPPPVATVPSVVYTSPEVAVVGEVGDVGATHVRLDHADHDRSLTAGEPHGFTELVADRRGRLVGATVVGAAAGEAIAELAAAVRNGSKVTELSAPHAYPSFSDATARAAEEWIRRRYDRPAFRRLGRTVARLRRPRT
ncbi:MAG: NAD(P)/FAD-dependent oxidoreductase [Actinomycetota bacterium]